MIRFLLVYDLFGVQCCLVDENDKVICTTDNCDTSMTNGSVYGYWNYNDEVWFMLEFDIFPYRNGWNASEMAFEFIFIPFSMGLETISTIVLLYTCLNQWWNRSKQFTYDFLACTTLEVSIFFKGMMETLSTRISVAIIFPTRKISTWCLSNSTFYPIYHSSDKKTGLTDNSGKCSTRLILTHLLPLLATF